jgi:hypothetical protein
MITMFGKIVIVNNELMKNKGTPESQTFKKKKIKKKKNKAKLILSLKKVNIIT